MNNTFYRKLNRAVALVFSLVMAVLSVTTAYALDKREKDVYESTANLLSYNNADSVNSVGGEWKVLGLARCDYRVPYSIFEEYVENITGEITEKSGVLSHNKYTEYSRVIVALSSINADVTNIAGYNLLTYLADYNKVKKQGINGPIWALIALDCKNYTIPKVAEVEVQTSREILIDYILQRELASGGWNLVGNSADCDVTSMAIIALSKYYNSNKEVKLAVDRGLKALSSLQEESGKFSSRGVRNSESTAQVIVALTSLGINPNTDTRFTKKGNTVVEALLEFSLESGGFSHTENGEYNQMATEQSFYALVALDRFAKGKNSIFNMTEEKENTESVDNGSYFDIKSDKNNNPTGDKNNKGNRHSYNIKDSKNNIDSNRNANNNSTKELKSDTANINNTEENTNSNKDNTPTKTGDKRPQKKQKSGEIFSNNTGYGEIQEVVEISSHDEIKGKKAVKEGETRSKMIFIILGVLLLAIIVFFVIRIIKRKKSHNSDTIGE